jgi:hypothetical protein
MAVTTRVGECAGHVRVKCDGAKTHGEGTADVYTNFVVRLLHLLCGTSATRLLCPESKGRSNLRPVLAPE